MNLSSLLTKFDEEIVNKRQSLIDDYNHILNSSDKYEMLFLDILSNNNDIAVNELINEIKSIFKYDVIVDTADWISLLKYLIVYHLNDDGGLSYNPLFLEWKEKVRILDEQMFIINNSENSYDEYYKFESIIVDLKCNKPSEIIISNNDTAMSSEKFYDWCLQFLNNFVVDYLEEYNQCKEFFDDDDSRGELLCYEDNINVIKKWLK